MSALPRSSPDLRHHQGVRDERRICTPHVLEVCMAVPIMAVDCDERPGVAHSCLHVTTPAAVGILPFLLR